MPRDGSGNYTLPALGNPAVTNTPITIAWWNGTSTDMATALTDSLSRSGLGGMLGPFGVVDGSAGAPGLTFASETTSGLYRPTGGEIDVSIGGTRYSRWTSAGFQESFDNGSTWKDPLYNNHGNQTFTGGLDFTSGSLTVGSVAVRGTVVTKSTSSGPFSTTSTSLAAIDNLSVTFTATGGPVLIQLVGDDSANAASMTVELGGASSALMTVALTTDVGSTFLGRQLIGNTAAAIVPSSSFTYNFTPSAGTVTVAAYTSIFASSGTPKAHVNYTKLCVTQL